MTTGRINQVTVLTRTAKSRTGHRVLGACAPFPPSQGLVTDRSKSSPRPRDPQGAPAHMGGSTAEPTGREFLVPRSHTPQGSSPSPIGLESAPSEETTGERPHLARGLPERGVSPIRWLQTELAYRLSDPHPSASTAESVKGALRSAGKAQSGQQTSPHS
jgi:hypothetical protein